MKCEKCGGKMKRRVEFFASKADVIGLFFVACVIALPIWGITSLINNTLFMAFEGVGTSFREGAVEKLMALEAFSQMLIFAYFYYLSLVKYGVKIAEFLSYFLNYRLKIEYECSICRLNRRVCDLPKEPADP